MGRPTPPGLSDPQRLVLSQFLAGHLSAGQLSERLRLAEQSPRPRSGRAADRPHRRRLVLRAAVGSLVAALAAAAIGFGIGSPQHVVAAHRAGTGRNQALDGYGSGRVVEKVPSTSGPSRSSSVSSGERIAVVGATGSTDRVPKANTARRRGHGFGSATPKHLRATGSPAATTPPKGPGATTPAGTTPQLTTPTGTTPSGSGPSTVSTPPGGTTASG